MKLTGTNRPRTWSESKTNCARYGVLKEHSKICGGDSVGEPPVPIPNTEVKPGSADGTWGGTPWESRKLPH